MQPMAPIEVPPNFLRTHLIIMVFVVVIHHCQSFELVHRKRGVTLAMNFAKTDEEGSDRVHPFFLARNEFHQNSSKLPAERLKGFTIPDEGGPLQVTRPLLIHMRKRRHNTTFRYELTTKINSNSIDIPEEGGPVHLDFPDFVKFGIGNKKKTIPEVGINRNDTSDWFGELPGNDTETSGSGESLDSNGTKNVTHAAESLQKPEVVYLGESLYPFFAAVHAKFDGEPSFDNVRCSGGIFNARAVVTSCSCLYGDGWPAPPFLFYYVSVGHQKFATANDTQFYHVSKVKYHPSCKREDTGLWKGNIAMLVIDKPGIKFNDFVQPMNLPKLKMWDASDVLAKMSDQRRHCRVIGWNSKAPLVDTALGVLIPLDECANPVCRRFMPCPRRNTVDGFMVEITPNEPSLLPGALLYCSDNVFAVVNTKRACTTNNIFASCSPEELLYTKFDFELTPESQREMYDYNSTFAKSIVGWETYAYPPTVEPTSAQTLITTRKGAFADVFSSGSILLPFYASRDASWIYTYIFAGYYGFGFK